MKRVEHRARQLAHGILRFSIDHPRDGQLRLRSGSQKCLERERNRSGLSFSAPQIAPYFSLLVLQTRLESEKERTRRHVRGDTG